MDGRPYVIIHPSDLTQSDWVRCVLPLMRFMCPNERMIFPSITQIACSNKEVLKRTSIVVIQRPTSPVKMQMVEMYAQLKRECGFRLVTDIDDLQWELSPIIKDYAKAAGDVEKIIKDRLKAILPKFDRVICSTPYLAKRLLMDLSVIAKVLPNAVSRSLFGFHHREVAFSGKPRVMYAGCAGHTTENDPGDFAGPWIPWIRKCVEDGKFDFYVFGEPDFLKGLEGKYTSIPFTSMMQFPAVAASYKPDFYLAPLCDINFNRAKSDLKIKEAAVLGAVFIGSDIPDGPYGYAPKEQLVAPMDSVEALDAKFSALCNPENYMSAINWQSENLEKNHWLYEDEEFQKVFLKAYMER